MKILFIGDIVGKPGRRAVEEVLPNLRREKKIDLVVANAENVTHGRGASLKHLGQLKSYGVDIFTSGDHIFYLGKEEPFSDPDILVIRPANYPPTTPGKGYQVLVSGGRKVAVVNLLGLAFLGERMGGDERNDWLEGEVANPFQTIEEVLEELEGDRPDLILVDFHAEMTSEKRAMGFFLDGKVTAVLGTHTHVPTADPTILPEGTAYISDIGMTGAEDSVLGVEPEIIIRRLREGGGEPFRWVEKGPAVFRSVTVDTDSKGLVKKIERLDLEVK